MAKELSCGIIITDGETVLGCLPTQKRDRKGNYDLPKGHINEGETPLQTALRELKEETTIEVNPKEPIFDMGRVSYRPNKDLHLFVYPVANQYDPATLSCPSTFVAKHLGDQELPEVWGYRLVPISELDYFFPSLGPLVQDALNRYAQMS